MPGRDLCDDPPAHDLICQFPSGPVANGALFRLRTSQRDHPGRVCSAVIWLFRPGRGSSLSRAWMGRSAIEAAASLNQRLRQARTVCGVRPSSLAIWLLFFPASASRMIQAQSRDLLGSRVPSLQTLQLPAFVFRQARTRAGFGPLIFGSPSSSGSRPSLLRGIDMESRTHVSESVG